MNSLNKWILILLPLSIVVALSYYVLQLLEVTPGYSQAIPIVVGFTVLLAAVGVGIRVFLGKWVL